MSIAPTSTAPRLQFANASKWYGSVTALMDVSFQVGNEVVGLVGRNGVGKTTLMKLAAGLLQPSQGEVRVAGVPAGSRAARAALGFCPDTDRLFESLTGVQFVAWMLRYHGLGAATARRTAEQVLDDLGLGPAMHRKVGTYSKGMRQRVRLGQALAHRPAVVLLDEPMTGLDPIARAELAERIAALPGRGVGVLVSSHVLHELEAIADRVVLVHQGRLLAEGKVADLRRQLPGRPQTYRLAAPDLRELAAALVALPAVQDLSVGAEGLLVTAGDGAAFRAAVTELAAAGRFAIREFVPVGDDLATVFESLVG
ncbi:MAG: ABC transporter ATP-binding protein [Planctomycetes bacterium]|nr:ABC transporter ATP-binding protein [Planctomycetota bacterium]